MWYSLKHCSRGCTKRRGALQPDSRPAFVRPFIYPPTPLGPTPCVRGFFDQKPTSEKFLSMRKLPRLLTHTKKKVPNAHFWPTWPREFSQTTTKPATLPGTTYPPPAPAPAPRRRCTTTNPQPRRRCTSLSHPTQHPRPLYSYPTTQHAEQNVRLGLRRTTPTSVSRATEVLQLRDHAHPKIERALVRMICFSERASYCSVRCTPAKLEGDLPRSCRVGWLHLSPPQPGCRSRLTARTTHHSTRDLAPETCCNSAARRIRELGRRWFSWIFFRGLSCSVAADARLQSRKVTYPVATG